MVSHIFDIPFVKLNVNRLYAKKVGSSSIVLIYSVIVLIIIKSIYYLIL